MTDAFKHRIEGLSEAAQMRFCELYRIVCEAAGGLAAETLWAGMPSFYAGARFVRLIPFQDHVNLEASAAASHRDELHGSRFTPKGMLQILHTQAVPEAAIRHIVVESLFPDGMPEH